MNEENNVIEDELITPEVKDELQVAITEQFEKIRLQNLLLGAQTSFSVIIQKITVWESQPGKRTLNDHRRLIKEIKQFCETGLSRKINPDSTISPIEEDSTKLMEEENE
jgi:hypothetical protein